MIWKLLLPILAALSQHSYYFKPSLESLSTRSISTAQQTALSKKPLPSYAALKSNIPTDDQRQKVRYALEQFKKTPGFDLLAERIRQQSESTIMGTLYELEAAVELERKGFEIIAFSQIYGTGDHACEIDIVARNNQGQRYCIECKDISWTNPPRVKKQLLRQQAIIKKIEKDTGHMLCSKKPIPPAMKDWLREQEIATA